MPRTTTVHRRGWTWVELIVVLAVIAVLVVLIVPGIQQAREAARRTQWRNNLKQIGLGFYNYHDNFGQFPLGGVFAPDGTPHHGWTIFVMPYMDASPLFNTIDFSVPWDDPRNV
jgi:prepilin-type N-terminal cleavage/methylation domain-containing protein